MKNRMEIFYGCDNYWDSLPVRRRERAASLAAMWLSILAAVSLAWTSQSETAGPYFIFVGMLLAYASLVVLTSRRFAYLRELERRWDDVPYRISCAAMDSFETGWREAAIECHEGHMPGECRLCGAQ